MGNKVKLLAVASIGGHWVQLLRIVSPDNAEISVTYLSTHPKCAIMVEGQKFYAITDFSRWNFYKLIPTFFKALKIIQKERPNIVVSTGAAPGLVVLLAAKLLGKKTVWIDSIANVQHLSLSGNIASRFVTRTFTQWESLKTHKILYAGNVLEQ
ncbi:oligosaccharide biosynthesis protein Alg14 [Pedobacter chinensis]|uniref:Oligosaccharide biosynthesis protein Alg14 n=1 Tax=Pedobacter chinensis TaxID=2282421 RepID=A0A369PNU9_9SPHI|nr:oligosaccharide biosynthesis protein Alg14 [Pedobacter chinensis]RDC54273.1 oligosaccharide biosynthesis protein Alg14 [Pedobacter chinensis]